MKTIIKLRWLLLAIWLIGAIGITIVKPDVNAILRERGQSALEEDSPSVVAGEMLEKMETTQGTSDLIVFFDEDGLDDNELNEISVSLQDMRDNSEELEIAEMIDPFSLPSAASSLISEDNTTLMVSIKVDKQDNTVEELADRYNAKLTNVSAQHYLSGEDFINNDYQTQSEKGVEKSAILTVLFILVVLIIVFRSVITPVISLIGVAFAYLTSSGIAAILIDKAEFPVTSLTSMLMILILFGIGTDYNILLFSRFKEELNHGKSVDEAIICTYKTAGKTIVFSIITVLIAFAALVLANCPIYKSGAMVMVGTIMLVLEILTLTPFFMKVLGKKLFWPSKSVKGHKESRLWGGMASLSSSHPIISFVLVILVITPMVISYKESLSFNLVGELGDSSPSSKGFNLVAEHFGEGQMMTSTIVIEGHQDLTNTSSLEAIDDLTIKLQAIDGVAKVASLTQPEGKKIDDFYLGKQMEAVEGGLSRSCEGLSQIYEGLEAAQASMGPNQFDDIINGLKQLSDGLNQTNQYLGTLNTNESLNIPAQALETEEYQQVMKMFLSEDHKITKLSVTLMNDPYSEAAQETAQEIKDTLDSTLKGTALADAKYGVAGTTANTQDTNNVLSNDLQRTAVIVIIGILLILIIIIRSIWIPLAIVSSLVGAYFAASTVVNIIFMNICGLEGISSFIPFFTFIIITALGVDYSIFLMMRFKEYPDMPVHEAITKACKQIGGVVLSAIIILGGTFATLIPSGMTLLEELAVGTIVGLAMLCFILLPIFLPAAMSLPDVLKGIFSRKKTV